MSITAFKNGASSFGVPLAGPSITSMFGNYWFVDNTVASVINTGKTPKTACKTIAAAVALASTGDTIYVRGTGTDYSEVVVVTEDNISLIGVSTHPKQLGWTSITDVTCLKLEGSGCLVDGFYFRPYGATSGVAIDIGYTGATKYGDRTTIQNNLFKSNTATCAYAIKANGCPEYVKIYNNHFTWCGYAIYGVVIPALPATGWEIVGNYFSDKCTNGIYLDARRSLVAENYFNVHTKTLDLLGAGTGTFNSVARNHFGGDYASSTGVYIAGTSDVWTGNWASDVAQTSQVEDVSGATSVVPSTAA